MPKDPVCGQYVSVGTPYKCEYEGEMYYFCSAACAEEFDINSEDYIMIEEPRAERAEIED
ncbi:MAG: YHS domain-containing protein [Armatimonadota bacterium]|nr:YHS domain-containing protein [bacterium]